MFSDSVLDRASAKLMYYRFVILAAVIFGVCSYEHTQWCQHHLTPWLRRHWFDHHDAQILTSELAIAFLGLAGLWYHHYRTKRRMKECRAKYFVLGATSSFKLLLVIFGIMYGLTWVNQQPPFFDFGFGKFWNGLFLIFEASILIDAGEEYVLLFSEGKTVWFRNSVSDDYSFFRAVGTEILGLFVIPLWIGVMIQITI